jgi:phosphogluconate dehydratase
MTFPILSDVAPPHHPNGSADVELFQAAGGTGYILRELADATMHADVPVVQAAVSVKFTSSPADHHRTSCVEGTTGIVRPATAPFSTTDARACCWQPGLQRSRSRPSRTTAM